MTKTETEKKEKKGWEQRNEGLTSLQKIIIFCVLCFVPLILFLVLSIRARNYYVETLKIPEELFLSAPEFIVLSKTLNTEPTYNVLINNVEFKIPNSFSPVNIGINQIEFRNNTRRLGRKIIIKSLPEAQTIEYSSMGLARWFMPKSVLKFIQSILRANWHPIKLMFKAQFFAQESITSKIFEARWDLHHRGFIFPTPGEKGYIGRVFGTNSPRYFEFSIIDEVRPVSLQEWINIAMKIKPPNQDSTSTAPPATSFSQLIQDSKNKLKAPKVLGQALSQFFHTDELQWLIPVGNALEAREYYAEVIKMHHKFLNQFLKSPKYKDAWNEMLDRTVSKILAIEIDPTLRTRELSIYCKNLTDSHIGQVWIQITAHFSDGSENSFMTSLLDHGRLFENQERKVTVTTPSDIRASEADKITFRIMQINFTK